jgi:hypothetical protein
MISMISASSYIPVVVMEQIIHLGLTLHHIDIVKKPILNIVVIFSKLMAGSEIVPTEKNQGTTNRYWSARS